MIPLPIAWVFFVIVILNTYIFCTDYGPVLVFSNSPVTIGVSCTDGRSTIRTVFSTTFILHSQQSRSIYNKLQFSEVYIQAKLTRLHLSI